MKAVRTKSKKADAKTGLKMVGGAAAGAAAGSLIGPVGAAVGAIVGGFAGANSRKLAASKPVKEVTRTIKRVATNAKKTRVVKHALAKARISRSPVKKGASMSDRAKKRQKA